MTRQDPNAGRIRPYFAAACALAVLLTLAGGSYAGNFPVKAVPVELDPRRPDVKTAGKLVFMSGFELISDHARFGGLSGLDVSPDGRQLRAVSDRGRWITATLAHDSAGRLISMDSWRDAPMLTPAGKHARGRYRDAEGLTRRSGAFLVSFERRHRIWRYPTALDVPPRPVATPRGLNDAPANGGLEGITVLPDGTVMGMTERLANEDGGLKGWLMKNGTAREIAYVTQNGFSPTGLAAMANGDVLLLERSLTLSGIRARVVRLAEGRLEEARRRGGSRVHGEVLADLKHPLSVDNFEGLALRRDRAGRTLLYLVSDDNFLPLQRTLLFQFRMID